eukprot:1166091-Pyramimonas_sp.AAC.2
MEGAGLSRLKRTPCFRHSELSLPVAADPKDVDSRERLTGPTERRARRRKVDAPVALGTDPSDQDRHPRKV